MKTVNGYRFVTNELESQNGKVQWKIGEWQKLDNNEPLELCENGFHASQKPIDSLNYIFGNRWFTCEARGEILKDTDKFCATEMRIVKEISINVIKQFAIDCAYHTLHIFEDKYPEDKRPRKAIEAAKTYLKYPTQENLDKLNSASDAARVAVWDAVWDAAWDAARVAVWDAAGDAAWDAENKWQNRHLLSLIKKELV